jgi:hypothetical protein
VRLVRLVLSPCTQQLAHSDTIKRISQIHRLRFRRPVLPHSSMRSSLRELGPTLCSSCQHDGLEEVGCRGSPYHFAGDIGIDEPFPRSGWLDLRIGVKCEVDQPESGSSDAHRYGNFWKKRIQNKP